MTRAQLVNVAILQMRKMLDAASQDAARSSCKKKSLTF